MVHVHWETTLLVRMALTVEELERELAEFKNLNPDWMTVEAKMALVTSYNNRVLALQGKLFYVYVVHLVE